MSTTPVEAARGAATSAGRRRAAYGANAVLQAILIVALVVGVIYVAQRFRTEADVTRSGVNSLSPRTRTLVAGLDQNIRITALYTVLSEFDEQAQKRQDRIRDLLRLYEAAGRGKVTAMLVDPMKDQAGLRALLERLKAKPAYQTEAAKHKEVLEQYAALADRVVTLINAQHAEATRLAAAPGAASVLAEVVQSLDQLRRQAGQVTTSLEELAGEDLPRYAAQVETCRAFLDGVTRYFRSLTDWVEKRAPNVSDLSPDALRFLQVAAGDYAPLLTDLDALLAKSADLPQLKLDQLASDLSRWSSSPPILVENDDRAEVVSFFDAWPMRRDGSTGPGGDDRDFAGEQALSSAILKLVQKEKVGVVFTRFGGPSPITPDFSQAQFGQFPRAPLGAINEELQRANFVTADWDVKTQKTPPEVEGAARRLYVVFPPEPAPQPDPRRPSPQQGMRPDDVKLVTDAVDAAGMAVFLAGFIPPSSPIPGMGASAYEYADYLKSSWGVEVKHDFVVLPFAPSPENPELFVPTQLTQQALIDTEDMTLGDQPVVKPLESMPIALRLACPLVASAGAAGVTIEPLLTLTAGGDAWALSNIMRLNEDFRSRQGTAPHEDDLKPPFALALAASKPAASATTAPATQPTGEQRLIVFGSEEFLRDQLLNMAGVAFVGSSLQTYLLYPGNSELFLNAVHWLTNDEGRISVGARRDEAPRLDKLKPGGWLDFWKVFMVGLWPAAALLVGAGVWLVRRG